MRKHRASGVVKMNEREIAKNIVRQWDSHDRYRTVAGEDNSEPDSVKVARALLRVDAEYGCEVRDPCGTIWEHAKRVEEERDKHKKAVESMRVVLLAVLENDEVCEGFNNNNLDHELKQQIRDAIARKV